MRSVLVFVFLIGSGSLYSQQLIIHQAVEIEVPTQAGQYYQLQASDDLSSWRSVGVPFRGTGVNHTQAVRAESAGQYFRSIQSVAVPSDREEVIFQHSTLGALLVGLYEGDLQFDRLLQRGDFGVGTFQGVDGELVVLDGQAYRIRVDGVASEVAGSSLTPFAVVTFFEPDLTLDLATVDSFESLQEQIDAILPSDNLLYAVKVNGVFSQLTTRSVPAQDRPYPALVDVVAGQTTFDFENIQGTMVGFRLPSYLSGINATGYHFHFIDQARQTGGHVLGFSATNLKVEIDVSKRLEMDLPEQADFLEATLE
jgi:acetolactate decarboxylase